MPSQYLVVICRYELTHVCGSCGHVIALFDLSTMRPQSELREDFISRSLPRLIPIDSRRELQEENPKFALFFADFKKLPVLQRLQALHLAVQNFNKAPKIGVYANEWFFEYRQIVKNRPFDTEQFHKHTKELYWSIR